MGIEDEIGKFGTFKKDYRWQDESIELFMSQLPTFYSRERGQFVRPYVNEVSPSGGKTIFSMKLAARLIAEGLIDRVVWCVPRDSIKLGFADDTRHVPMAEHCRSRIGSRFIVVDTELTSTYKGWLPNHHGIVITYQALSQPSMLGWIELLAHKHRLLIIFDEVHHGSTGDDDEEMNVWGRYMQSCRALAHAIVCMTGTPLRSDSQDIPFLEYVNIEGDDGRVGVQVKPDYSFSYQKAVTAGIARKIICRSQDVEITYDVTDPDGVVRTYCREVSSIPSAHLQKVKNTAFCFNRGVVDKMLRLAHEECERFRRTGDPDAAILVIGRRGAGETNSLDKIKDRILGLFGEAATTVEHTDGPAARAAIRKFKNGTDRWVVAKEMISEGTNLPRLRIVVILRDIGNRTFYEQLVHRTTRNDADDRPQDAIILQAKFPHLHEWGSDLERQANIGWRKRKQQRGEGAGPDDDAPDKPLVEGICAELERETVILEGEDVTDVDPLGRELHARVGLVTKTSRWQIDKLLKELPNIGIPLGNMGPPIGGDDLFSKDEEFKRRSERGQSYIKAAAEMLKRRGVRDPYPKLTFECKKAAGIRCHLRDVMRDHPKPLDAIKMFEQAAYRALERVKRDGEAA
jgi:superfamily II DNA or RNA helicase